MNIDITDVAFEAPMSASYNLGIFAGGYEQRSIYLPGKFSRSQFDKVTCMRFAESLKSANQVRNCAEIDRMLSPTFLNLKNDSDEIIYEHLRDLDLKSRKASLLIDYSSMTRYWYGAVLNWAFHNSQFDELTLDFCYSAGTYEDNVPALEIKDILCIPGCEGTSISASRSIAIFGLGFDPWAPLCVIDKLEPDRVFAVVADPGAAESDAEKACQINREIIEKHAGGQVIRLPLDSVEVAYQRLIELISPYRGNSQITIICLGPKPHVLSSILLAMSHKDVASLHISSSRKKEYDVSASGKVICTRVRLWNPDAEPSEPK